MSVLALSKYSNSICFMLLLNCFFFFLACCLYGYFASNCDPWAVKALHKPPAKGLLSSEEGAACQPACCHLKMFLWSILLFCRIIWQALTLLLRCLLLSSLLAHVSSHWELALLGACNQQHDIWNDACTGGSGSHQNPAVWRACWKGTDSQQEGLGRPVQTNGNFSLQIKLCYRFQSSEGN